MEDGSVGHNFESDPPKDHSCQVWFNLVQWFQRRFKCDSLRLRTDLRRRMPRDGKSSHDLCPGELKALSKRKYCALTLYMGAAFNRLVSYDEKHRVSTGTCAGNSL